MIAGISSQKMERQEPELPEFCPLENNLEMVGRTLEKPWKTIIPEYSSDLFGIQDHAADSSSHWIDDERVRWIQLMDFKSTH